MYFVHISRHIHAQAAGRCQYKESILHRYYRSNGGATTTTTATAGAAAAMTVLKPHPGASTAQRRRCAVVGVQDNGHSPPLQVVALGHHVQHSIHLVISDTIVCSNTRHENRNKRWAR